MSTQSPMRSGGHDRLDLIDRYVSAAVLILFGVVLIPVSICAILFIFAHLEMVDAAMKERNYWGVMARRLAEYRKELGFLLFIALSGAAMLIWGIARCVRGMRTSA